MRAFFKTHQSQWPTIAEQREVFADLRSGWLRPYRDRHTHCVMPWDARRHPEPARPVVAPAFSIAVVRPSQPPTISSWFSAIVPEDWALVCCGAPAQTVIEAGIRRQKSDTRQLWNQLEGRA